MGFQGRRRRRRSSAILTTYEHTYRRDTSAYVNIRSKWEEQELNDDNRQARFWRPPNQTATRLQVNEMEHIIYVLEFKRVSDAGEGYVAETQRAAIRQHLAATKGSKRGSREEDPGVEVSRVESRGRGTQGFLEGDPGVEVSRVKS